MDNHYYLSLEMCQRIRAKLGRRAPKPLRNRWWCVNSIGEPLIHPGKISDCPYWPAYELHDLLTRNMCEKLARSIGRLNVAVIREHVIENTARDIRDVLASAYYCGGYELLERLLKNMMERNNENKSCKKIKQDKRCN